LTENESSSDACGVPSGCRLAVKAIPNAPQDVIVGWLGNALKVKIHAPAVDGRANEALCSLLARKFVLPRRAVTMVKGEKSRHKVLQIDGLTDAEVRARVG
jgi:uncharacterized protein (TIGR00251 family)